MKCCICGKTIKGFGNNPYPLCADNDFDSRCCDECDSKYVIPVRILKMRVAKNHETYLKSKNKSKKVEITVWGGDLTIKVNKKDVETIKEQMSCEDYDKAPLNKYFMWEHFCLGLGMFAVVRKQAFVRYKNCNTYKDYLQEFFGGKITEEDLVEWTF